MVPIDVFQRILGVLGTGFDRLGCDGMDDFANTDVFDRESFAVLVEEVWFPYVLC